MDQSKSSYPGNRDLPVEVKDRVVSTYQQSLEMHRQGRPEEARAGCELILRMDGSFAPARRLLEALQSSAAPSESPVSDSNPGALTAAKRALETRDFRRAVELSNTVLRAELTNQEAQDIGREAQELLEAEPFVAQYLEKARTHIAAGHPAAARAELEKARSLDPGNPGLSKLETQAPAPPPAAPAPATFDFGGDAPFQFDFATPPSPMASDTSFILDEPPPAASARSSQASDFGFSFEEEAQPAPQPVSAPLPPASAPETQPFDFSSASTESNDSDRSRIDGLLEEGDMAFEQADYRQATEIWSKIFLVDVTNSAASERIEKARRLQQELDTRVDGILTNAIVAFEAGEFATARSGFEEALRLDPIQPAANEYLQKIPAGLHEPDLASIDFHPPPPMLESEEDLYAAYGIPQSPASVLDDNTFSPAVPPSPGSSASARPGQQSGTRPARRRGSWFMIVPLLLVLGGAGWFAWSQLSEKTPETADDQTALILTRAQALAKSERYDQAIDLLSSVNASDPMHDEALALIVDYRGLKSAGAATVDGKPAALAFSELIEQGRVAFLGHDYVAAKDSLTRAGAIQPLPPESAAILQNATLQVAKLDSALVLFKEGKYDAAVTTLQGLLEQNPQNRNIQQLLENAHFNLGATALRGDRLDDAIREFDSVIASNPNDDLARRSREIALRYREAPKDLLFRIYVKYLPLR